MTTVVFDSVLEVVTLVLIVYTLRAMHVHRKERRQMAQAALTVALNPELAVTVAVREFVEATKQGERLDLEFTAKGETYRATLTWQAKPKPRIPPPPAPKSAKPLN